jgi:hypothetical protein
MPNQILYTATKANTSKPIEFWNPVTQQYQDSNPLTGIAAGTYSGLKVRLKGSNPEIVANFSGSVTVTDGSGNGGDGGTGPSTWTTAPAQVKLIVDGAPYDSFYPYSTTAIDGSKAVASNGSSIIFPDGNKFYQNAYVNDGSMAIAARPDMFNAAFLLSFVEYFRARTTTSGQFAYIVPEYVSATGVIGTSAQGGARPSLDRNPYFVNLVWELYKRQGNANYYTVHKAFIDRLMTDGMNLTNGIPKIADLAFDTPGQCPFAQVGFNDSEFVSGASTHLLALYWKALNQLAEMAEVAGDTSARNSYLAKAGAVQTYANTNLYDVNYGMYRASDGNAHAQREVWGSCVAVFNGMTSSSAATKISQTLVTKLDLWYFDGGARCIMQDTDDRPGVACWPAFVKGDAVSLRATGQAQVTADPTLSVGPNNAFGRYQQGYWTTYMREVIYTVALTDATLAKQLFAAVANKMVNSDGVETFSKDGFSQVPKYTASMGPLGYVQRDNSPVVPNNQVHNWALRKRNASYSGPAVRVRRTSDNTEMDIGFAANGGLNTAAFTSFVGSSTARVTKWYDQSSFQRHLAQASLPNQPTMRLDGPNSLPTIDFLGAEQMYCSAIWSGASSRLLVSACQNLTAGGQGDYVSVIGGQRAKSEEANTWFILQIRDTQGAVGSPYLAGYGSDLTDSTVPNLVQQVASAAYDGTTAFLRRNGNQVASAARNYNTGAVNGLFVLGNDAGTKDAPNSHIALSEVTCANYYNASLAASEENSMKAYFSIV